MSNNCLLTWFSIGILSFLLTGCGDSESGVKLKRDLDVPVIHELADPDGLHPYISQGASSTYIQGHIFEGLLSMDPITQDLIPVLATTLPEVEEITEGYYAGGMKISYEIRPEATWNNGQPITALDIDFTLKAIKNPKADTERARPYYEFLDSIWIDPSNNKRFSFFVKDRYMRALSGSGLFTVLPEYVYDPDGLMRKFTLHQLNNPKNADALKENADIIAFAQLFSQEKFAREKDYVIGSGPYVLKKWTTGQRIEVERNPNWWGEKMKGVNVAFDVVPSRIVHEVYNDQTTALVAMKGGKLDVTNGAKPKDFVELKTDANFTKDFNLHDPSSFSYYYIGLNLRNKILQDKAVRKAMAQLVDKNMLIDNVFYGFAEITVGPFHNSRPYYNKNIKPYDFNVEQARQILKDAGWEDTNGNGTLDKEIDGERVEFQLTYTFNTGNQQRETIGLLLQETARKVGVKIDIKGEEWSVFLENTKNHKFDIYCGAWIGVPLPDDPKQIWHTESIEGGSNYVSFGNDYTDALIDSIRYELNEENRNKMYLEFQEILHEEVPYIFMFALRERIIIHNRFTNTMISEVRPGYNTHSFTLRPEYQAAQ